MPDATPVKVGVIGVGVLGAHHARLYAAAPDAKLVGVYDPNGERAAEIAALHGCRAYDDIEDLAMACDALSVAVPTDRHYEVVLGLLRADRHVLVEKPLCANTAHGRELVEVAAARGLVLMVGHVERFNPVITYLREKINRPLFIESHRLADYPKPREGMLPRGTEVGVTLDLMIHDLDIILHLVNSPVERIEAVGLPILSKTEDIANARITFKNGCVANVTASRVSPETVRKIRVFQPDAYFSLDYGAKKGEIYTRGATGIGRTELKIEDANALQEELQNFVSCVAKSRATGTAAEPLVSGVHGLKALELAEDITRAIHKHLANLQDAQRAELLAKGGLH